MLEHLCLEVSHLLLAESIVTVIGVLKITLDVAVGRAAEEGLARDGVHRRVLNALEVKLAERRDIGDAHVLVEESREEEGAGVVLLAVHRSHSLEGANQRAVSHTNKGGVAGGVGRAGALARGRGAVIVPLADGDVGDDEHVAVNLPLLAPLEVRRERAAVVIVLLALRDEGREGVNGGLGGVSDGRRKDLQLDAEDALAVEGNDGGL